MMRAFLLLVVCTEDAALGAILGAFVHPHQGFLNVGQGACVLAGGKRTGLKSTEAITHNFQKITVKDAVLRGRIIARAFLELNHDQGIPVFRGIVCGVDVILMVCTTGADLAIPVDRVQIVVLLNGREFLF